MTPYDTQLRIGARNYARRGGAWFCDYGFEATHEVAPREAEMLEALEAAVSNDDTTLLDFLLWIADSRNLRPKLPHARSSLQALWDGEDGALYRASHPTGTPSVALPDAIEVLPAELAPTTYGPRSGAR